jgi:hypothetical protein
MNGKDSWEVKLVRLIDNAAGCTLAFIPEIASPWAQLKKLLAKFCDGQRAFYCDSLNSFMRHINNQNMVCTSWYFQDNIPILE